jgi:DnaK suppressor protein
MNANADWADLHEELMERRRALKAELRRLTAPPTESVGVSFGKRVGDGTTEAVERMSTTATARSLAASIDDVDRAIEKIESGTYGVCDACGAVIPLERLAALPATAHCVGCAGSR